MSGRLYRQPDESASREKEREREIREGYEYNEYNCIEQGCHNGDNAQCIAN